MYRLIVIILAVGISACESGSESAAPCPPNCGSDVATINVEAGPRIMAFEGTSVTLSGFTDQPANIDLRYQWRQVAGPSVVLDAPDSLTTAFVAPYLGIPDNVETMTFRLTATASDGAFGFDSVVVEVQRAVAVSGCAAAATQPGVAAFQFPHCTIDDVTKGGSGKSSPLLSQVEYESNDSLASATLLAFPQDLLPGRTGTSIAGTIGVGPSSGALIADRADFYLFSPPVAGTFAVTLCEGDALCSRGAKRPDWRVSLQDQDGNELADTGFGALHGKSFVVQLDAGLPYYVAVESQAAGAAAEPYRLSIVAD